jgi:hypothetical protein
MATLIEDEVVVTVNGSSNSASVGGVILPAIIKKFFFFFFGGFEPHHTHKPQKRRHPLTPIGAECQSHGRHSDHGEHIKQSIISSLLKARATVKVRSKYSCRLRAVIAMEVSTSDIESPRLQTPEAVCRWVNYNLRMSTLPVHPRL